ncbi:MAG: nitrate reductase maturation protein NarM [Fibrobacteria bacterium]|nr:nitrate reductase maturation protein NarM [Fibrobacteria bacterium]
MVLRIGFIPLADCAPLVVASEMGHFAAQGLEVELSKAQTWEQVRSKLERGDFQAAHLPATLPILAALGIGGSRDSLCTAWVLSQTGNAITLSNRLRSAGIGDARDLARWMESNAEILKFGIVHPSSTHELMIREWLSSGGLEIGPRIQLLVSPPQEMVRRMREGLLDGFCAGEPWNQRATTSKLGEIVALGEDVMSPGVEKVLAVRRAWHEENPSLHAALLRALDAASKWLDDPAHLDEAAALIAGKRFVNTQETLLRSALARKLNAGRGRIATGSGFLRFSGPGVNLPRAADFRWFLERLVYWGHVPSRSLDLDLDGICLSSFHLQSFPRGDSMDRIFAYEAEFAENLVSIPMAVRRKLDLSGTKLSLAQWSKLPVTRRRALLEAPTESPDAVLSWKNDLLEAVRANGGGEVRECPIEEHPVWRNLEAVPSDLADLAARDCSPISLGQWRSLDELARFALVKLSRPGRENRNFLPAMKEFGLA